MYVRLSLTRSRYCFHSFSVFCSLLPLSNTFLSLVFLFFSSSLPLLTFPLTAGEFEFLTYSPSFIVGRPHLFSSDVQCFRLSQIFAGQYVGRLVGHGTLDLAEFAIATGCECSPGSGNCLSPGSKCACISSGACYTPNGKLLMPANGVTPPILECHATCSCSADCGNRVVQKGVTRPLEVRPHSNL